MTSSTPSITLTPRIPGLDGLRAFAVIVVVLYHLFPAVFTGGFIGVDVFFVISGFIITVLLFKEFKQTGTIRIRQFWLRRVRRLLPALIIVVLATVLAAIFIGGGVLADLHLQVVGALTFTYNWIEIFLGSTYAATDVPHVLGHFWSLAVEEQFYLLWPLLLLALLILPKVMRYRAIFAVTLIIALLSALAMAVLYSPDNLDRVYIGTDTHIFGLMIGAGLATMHNSLGEAKRYGGWLKVAGWTSCILLLVASVLLGTALPFAFTSGLLLVSILTALLIVAIIHTRGTLHSVFTHPFAEWIGQRSYGIYLWHYPVIVLLMAGLGSDFTQQWYGAALAVVIMVGLAALSYRYIEMPIRSKGFKAYLMHRIGSKI